MKHIYIVVFIIILLELSCISNKTETVSGVYVNTNYNYDSFIAEIPYTSDTLILKEDNSFESGFYGKGTYTVQDGHIKLLYKYEFGVATYQAPIEVNNCKVNKILLSKDNNHYYQRIEPVPSSMKAAN